MHHQTNGATTATVLEGIDWAMKIVDDIIVCAENMNELIGRVRQILQRCRSLGITISRKIFEFGEEMDFAGHRFSGSKGIRPDDTKFEAISKFPTPKNVKDLRSFLGLAQQLGAFIPDLAHMTHD